MKLTSQTNKFILPALATAAFVATIPEATAAVACGDTITRPTRLTENLTCGTDPAVTVVGPAQLDLNGYTITCTNDSFDGVELTGENARVKNGTVTGCDDGVYVTGVGGHLVLGIHATANNDGIGISSSSDNNTINNNQASDSGDDGIEIDGDDNTVVNNEVSVTGDEGIEVDGDGNRVMNNVVTGANNDGICLDGEENKVAGNFVSQSGDHGIEVDDDENQITGNRSENNGGHGIVVFLNETNNSLHGNIASGNTDDDLSDDNPDCDDNNWSGNQGTVDKACIQ